MHLNILLFGLLLFVTNGLGFVIETSQINFINPSKESIVLPQLSKSSITLPDPVKLQSPHDVLDYEIILKDTSRPQQVVLLVESLNHGFEFPIKPTHEELDGGRSKYTFKIEVAALPRALLHYATTEREPLAVSLVLADKENNDEDNLLLQVFDIKLYFLLQDNWELPYRFGPQKEIYHQFNPAPAAAPRSLSLIFSTIIAGICFVFLSSWVHFMGRDMIRKIGMGSLYKTGFLVSVTLIEVIFIRYSLCTDIFTTLRHTAYISAVALYVGSRALRHLAAQRSATATTN